MKYNLIVCGGTFDRLHAGHEAFLRFVFSQGENVIIGVTSDAYIGQYKKISAIASFISRKEALITFLAKEGFISRVQIVAIDDIYGPTLDEFLALDAIVVTDATIQGGEIINQERGKRGLPLLSVISMPLIQHNGNIISSSAVRDGKIRVDGTPFINPKWMTAPYLLPQKLRETLQQPLGDVITSVEEINKAVDRNRIITVGDVTTAYIHAQKLSPQLAVVDFFVERKKQYTALFELGFSGDETVYSVANAAGTLQPEMWQVVTKLISELTTEKQFIIQVQGEEDLAVLPLVLSLPIGYTLFYGQPQQGLVCVPISVAVKEKIATIMSQFTRLDY